jgi:hypothetical protein
MILFNITDAQITVPTECETRSYTTVGNNQVGLPSMLVAANSYIYIPLIVSVNGEDNIDALEISIEYNPNQIDILDGSRPKDCSQIIAVDGRSYNVTDTTHLYKVSAINTVNFNGEYLLWIMRVRISDVGGTEIPLRLNANFQDTIVPGFKDGTLKVINLAMFGDINRDYSVTTTDASKILKASVGHVYFDDTTRVIANVSGSIYGVTSYSAYLVLQKSIGNLSSFPVECGYDPYGNKQTTGEFATTVSQEKMNFTTKNPVINGDLWITLPVGVTAEIGPALNGKYYEMKEVNGKLKVSFFGTDSIFSSSGPLIKFKGSNVKDVVIEGIVNNNTPIKVTAENTTEVNNQEILPSVFLLNQNYPNPFNPSTTISYQLPTDGLVTLKVYDVLGKEVTTLVNEQKQAGNHSVKFNAVNLTSGTYIYKISTGSFVQNKKMNLMK